MAWPVPKKPKEPTKPPAWMLEPSVQSAETFAEVAARLPAFMKKFLVTEVTVEQRREAREYAKAAVDAFLRERLVERPNGTERLKQLLRYGFSDSAVINALKLRGEMYGLRQYAPPHRHAKAGRSV